MALTRSDGVNAVALLGACLLALACGWQHRAATAADGPSGTVIAEVRSADGAWVPAGPYQRIISLDPAIDDALAEMGMATRLLAISSWSYAHASRARLLHAVPHQLPAGASLEDLLALQGDLVLVSGASDPLRSAHLRSAGMTVFDCGSERTAADAAQALRQVATLLAQPALGTQLASRFLSRLARVRDPRLPELGACYVAIYGGELLGGTLGTTYHDLLVAATLGDAAMAHGWRDWPTYHLEDLVAMAPQVILTGTGMGATLRALPGAARIPALAADRIIEVDPDLLSLTGIGELEAAEAVAAGRAQLP